jgi:hypothetical protein
VFGRCCSAKARDRARALLAQIRRRPKRYALTAEALVCRCSTILEMASSAESLHGIVAASSLYERHLNTDPRLSRIAALGPGREDWPDSWARGVVDDALRMLEHG